MLLLHRTLPADAVIAGMNAALSSNIINPDLVAVEARRAIHPGQLPPLVVPVGQTVNDRPAPSLADYDQLLTGALA